MIKGHGSHKQRPHKLLEPLKFAKKFYILVSHIMIYWICSWHFYKKLSRKYGNRKATKIHKYNMNGWFLAFACWITVYKFLKITYLLSSFSGKFSSMFDHQIHSSFITILVYLDSRIKDEKFCQDLFLFFFKLMHRFEKITKNIFSFFGSSWNCTFGYFAHTLHLTLNKSFKFMTCPIFWFSATHVPLHSYYVIGKVYPLN